MLAQQLGFTTSWKMLTRDSGWLKPVMVLALIGWIPIVGQVAILGYGLEWARLTAWGVDATIKQRGIDFGKVARTGFRAFCVGLTLTIAVGIVLSLLLGGSVARIFSFLPLNISSLAWNVLGDFNRVSGWGILGIAVGLFLGSFSLAAMLRATLYDAFAAGWRLDRLAQMIARDFTGFLRMWLAAFVGAVILFAYSTVMFLLLGTVAVGGVFAFTHGGFTVFALGENEYLIRSLLALGVGPVLLLIIAVVLAIFAYAVLSVAFQLVAINACGQWFCRFAVDRWGLSSDPLPDGVPCGTYSQVQRDAPPARPEGTGTRPASEDAGTGSASGDSGTSSTPDAAADTTSDAAADDGYWDAPVSPR